MNPVGRITPSTPVGPAAAPARRQGGGAAPGLFDQMLAEQLQRQQPAPAAPGSVGLSNHAAKRVDQRALGLDAASMARLGSAMDKAQQKGGRTSLIVLDGVAVVANVQERKIVTAMPVEQSKIGRAHV